MATISLTLPVAGNVIAAGLHATNYTAIQTMANGGIDNNNINASAAIAYSKLSLANAILTTDISTAAGNAWAAYSPAWTTLSGTAPAIGNGSIAGRWVQMGKTIHGRILLTAGTTTTFGNGGIWAFSIPTAAHASYDGSIGLYGTVSALDTSASAIYDGFFRTNTATTATLDTTASPISNFTNAAPVTWATGDKIGIYFTYEAA